MKEEIVTSEIVNFDGEKPGALPAGWVALDGKAYIESTDSHITGAGAVGVWTKASCVTSFDDFKYGK